MHFEQLGLSADLLRTVREEGYTEPTPVQERAIPLVLEGRDVLAAAQTGTGKTAAFALPILDRLRGHANTSFSPARHPVRCLVLTPTRELAVQVADLVKTYGRHVPLRSAVVYGGVPLDPQIKELRAGVEILVATPGRLLDLVGQRATNLAQAEILVLDEGDRMLDMGFMPDIRRILDLLPSRKQTLLFSATFSDEIKGLAGSILHDPVTIEVAPHGTAAESVRQLVYPVDRDRKEDLLRHLILSGDWHQVLVFTRTKLTASRLASWLDRRGVAATAIHSDRAQADRTRALEGFQGRRDPGPGGDRCRRSRARHRGPAARRELRAPVEPRGLRPPDRADGPSGCDRRRGEPGVHRRGRSAARRPAPAAACDPMDRGGRVRAPAGRRAAAAANAPWRRRPERRGCGRAGAGRFRGAHARPYARLLTGARPARAPRAPDRRRSRTGGGPSGAGAG